MTFEEEFPSLKGVSVGQWDDESFSLVVKHCLDKERVRRAIDKVIPVDEQDANSVIINTALKKELNL